MRVLLTGGHGFVGSHLVRRLLAEGDEVRCLVRRPGVPESLAGLPVTMVVGDVTKPSTLPAALEGVDEVYHLAARLTASSEAEMFRTNAGGTRHLVEAAARRSGLARFVHCSSIAAAGPSEPGRPNVETGPCRPVTWYGASKALAERVVLAYGERGLPVTLVRPPAVYGPRDRALLSMFQTVARGWKPLLGAQPKHYTWAYGPDLADALLTLGRHPDTKGRTYYACHPEVVTLEDFLATLSAALGRPGRTLRVPDSLLRVAAGLCDLAAQVTGSPTLLTRDKVHEVVAPAWVCSPAAAALDAGWHARTPISVGLAETVRWYVDAGWLSAVRR